MRTGVRVVLVVGFVATAALIPSRTASATTCAPNVGTFVGRIVAIDGSSITYLVESFEPSDFEFAPASPKPIVGDVVVVHYGRYDGELLRVGRRYSVTVRPKVTVWPAYNGFFSDIHTAGGVCDGGTVNADGSQIDTALVRQPHVRRWFFEFVAVSVGLVLLTSVWAVRKRRRQRENVEQLLRLGP